MTKSEDIFRLYYDDFYAEKFNLGSQLFGDFEQKFLNDEIIQAQSVQRKIAILHVYYHFYQFDSSTLSLIRVVDDIHKRFIPNLEIKTGVLETVIEAIYNTLETLASATDQFSIDNISYVLSKYKQIVSYNLH